MFLLSNIRFCGGKYFSKHCQGSFFPFIVMVCIFSLEAVLMINSHPQILLPVAIFVSSITIIVGIMDIFLHGPRMKKLSTMITCYEGRFESAFQLLMYLVLLITEQDKDKKDRFVFLLFWYLVLPTHAWQGLV